ncbi:MAG: methyltransferase domain-containing protein [Sedimentisphaerales bacterium]|nr:methyltransferase domain-containing protein [Sedimentisphaerales bacterium]
MSKYGKKSSKELGLEVAALGGRHFFNIDHLHYGYWANGLEANMANFPLAQEKYTDFLLGHIPADLKTILDVGCGTGKNAKRLTEMGYKVDCVSPSHYLAERTREILWEGNEVFECEYEQLETTKRYDCVFFSESFQYVHLVKGIEQSVNLLNEGGYLLICDVFRLARVDKEGGKVIGGGHRLEKFLENIKKAGLEKVVDEDITAETAPTIEILDEAMFRVGRPALEASLEFLHDRHPWIMGILNWKYRKKLDKFREKYIGDRRTSDDFKKYKTYRLFICKKI